MPTSNELKIMCKYSDKLKVMYDAEERIRNAGIVVAAFNNRFKLLPEELDILLQLVATR